MILKQSSENIMNVNYEIFKKLLTIDEIFELYSQIGESVSTFLDIKNINKDNEAKNNSIQLLIGTLFISYDPESKTHNKKSLIDNKSLFIAKLYQMLTIIYPNAFFFIKEVEIHYDEIEAEYYTKRNYIELNLSGLIMLLNGMGIIRIKGNNIYFVKRELLSDAQNPQRKTSLTELIKQLHIQEELGNEAELKAIEYEKRLLLFNNIVKKPERVSLYDVKAGYDIASYMTGDSHTPDKFIEVKSCTDHTFRFFISRNEIETAKIKGDHYYLYLLNRKTNNFKVICNPYKMLFESGKGQNWAVEPQVYQIHAIL